MTSCFSPGTAEYQRHPAAVNEALSRTSLMRPAVAGPRIDGWTVRTGGEFDGDFDAGTSIRNAAAAADWNLF